jgi:hypothetical protein
MAPFFHWHGHPDRWHRGWQEHWHRHERFGDQPDDGPPPPSPPSPPSLFGLPLPPLPFGLETGAGPDEYDPGDQEAESHHRRRWGRYQTSDQNGESESGFASEDVDADRPRRTGRWVRHGDRIILRDV